MRYAYVKRVDKKDCAFPVVGYTVDETGHEVPQCWTLDGRYYFHSSLSHPLDIITSDE